MGRQKDKSAVESALDLNSMNIWSYDANEIMHLWNEAKKDEGFEVSEEKILNLMRLAFEVVHFNKDDRREAAKYDNGEWVIFNHVSTKKGCVAIRRKTINRLTDLSYENIKHITAATLLELIDRNFGGGWDSIPLSIKDIIDSAFDVSTTQLPQSRIHAAGGTVERRVAAGFEVLEIAKGTWVEAIFAKKKELVYNIKDESEEDGYSADDDDEIFDGEDGDDFIDDEEEKEEEDDMIDEEEFYSSYSEEANAKDIDEEAFEIED